MSIMQYQTRVLGPSEVVDYSTIVMQSYPPDAIRSEPFVGFKVLCRDTHALSMNPLERLNQIDANLGFLNNKGCIIRETAMAMSDGLWVITMPVPRKHISIQLSNLMDVLAILEQHFGIVRHGLFEINVSGRCSVAETEICLSTLAIPPRYMSALVMPENTPYRLGNIVRINDNYMVLRTRWNLTAQVPLKSTYDELVVLSQLISSMYH